MKLHPLVHFFLAWLMAVACVAVWAVAAHVAFEVLSDPRTFDPRDDGPVVERVWPESIWGSDPKKENPK